jgi:hypothetical protein
MERLICSEDKAEAILSLKFSDDDERRMRELMDRNNKGTLTSDELAEMEGFRRVGTLLGILQGRARLLLRNLASDN